MYEKFFNLKEKPFHLSPDPRFFFPSAGHNRVLAYLRYGVREGEGFIVVTGEIGAGKTTLIRLLLEELSDKLQNYVIAHIATTQSDADELLAMVTAAFGLEIHQSSKAVLLTRLNNFLHEQSREGKRALLIIDDAEKFTPKGLEELLMLTNFLNNQKTVLQGFLVGQLEFRSILQAEHLEPLRQRIIASCHLGPLEQKETQQYIEHRLQVAGWQGDPDFTPDVYKLIQNYTDGIPRRINALCDRILLVAYLEEVHAITPSLIGAVIQELRIEQFGITQETTQEIPEPNTSLEYKEMVRKKPATETSEIKAIEQRLSNLETRFEAIEEVTVMVRAAIRAVLSKQD